MSQTREALHDILEFAANTDCNMQIRIDTWEGELSITTTIDSTEKREADNNDIFDKLIDIIRKVRRIDELYRDTERPDPIHGIIHERIDDVIFDLTNLCASFEEEA